MFVHFVDHFRRQTPSFIGFFCPFSWSLFHISALIFIISIFLYAKFQLDVFLSSSLGCDINLCVWELSSLLLHLLLQISPLSSACAMSHKFGYVAFLFSIKKFSNFPFWEFFLPIGCSGMDCLFSTYLWIFQFFFFFWFSFILLWLEKSVGMISIFLNLLKLVIYPEECPVCAEECILLPCMGCSVDVCQVHFVCDNESESVRHLIMSDSLWPYGW